MSAPFLIALLLAVCGAQLLIWLIARHSTYVEMWRVLPVAIIGVFSGNFVLHGISESSPTQIAGFALAGAFAAWIVIGLIYELELPQRLAVSLSTPVIGILASLGGHAFNNELLRQVGA